MIRCQECGRTTDSEKWGYERNLIASTAAEAKPEASWRRGAVRLRLNPDDAELCEARPIVLPQQGAIALRFQVFSVQHLDTNGAKSTSVGLRMLAPDQCNVVTVRVPHRPELDGLLGREVTWEIPAP